MTVFDTMLDTLFGDPNMASDAVYTPAAGSPAACRVALVEGDRAADLGLSAAATPATVAELRASEIAAPTEGDMLAIGARSFTVKSVQARDATRLVWRLALAETTGG